MAVCLSSLGWQVGPWLFLQRILLCIRLMSGPPFGFYWIPKIPRLYFLGPFSFFSCPSASHFLLTPVYSTVGRILWIFLHPARTQPLFLPLGKMVIVFACCSPSSLSVNMLSLKLSLILRGLVPTTGKARSPGTIFQKICQEILDVFWNSS